jgi:hypothetical protein
MTPERPRLVGQDSGVSEGRVELFIVDLVAVATGRHVYAVRCHAGTLRLGDELTVAVDPEGVVHAINARCSSIALTPGLPVEELSTNYGGEVTLDGIDLNPIQEGWTVRSEG